MIVYNGDYLEYMLVHIVFGIKWIKWKRTFIFNSWSPTKEFEVGLGVRQDDPLGYFLFLIMDEGMVGLSHKIIQNSDLVERLELPYTSIFR